MTITALDFDTCYAAASGRDRRFDGQFVLGVSSTGIYCRPSCPARTPKPAHCTFFPTSAAAHLAGYRACKRCLPEAVPGSPAWHMREDVAARAMRLIGEGVVDREGVPGLAARLGYSPRQLGRILTDELGASALALARAQRAQTARQLLVSTPMPAVDVAFAAGFASVRQFNDTIAEVFQMTPTALRYKARRSERDVPPGTGTVTVRLRAREPFAGNDVVDWMGVRAIGGLECVESGSLTRTVLVARGAGVLTMTPGADHVSVSARLDHLADLPEALARARRLFDLDADPVAIEASLTRDPRLTDAVSAAPGIRVPGTSDPFEMLVRAILGQQVTVASARTAVQGLVDALGTPLPRALASAPVHTSFPSPHVVAERAPEVIRGPRGRIRALVLAAAAVAEGTLVLDAGRTRAELAADLEAIPGIGPWTSHYVALRVLNSPDVLLTGDSAVRAGAAALGLPTQPRDLADAALPFAPWRSYLMMHFWRAAAPAPTSKEP